MGGQQDIFAGEKQVELACIEHLAHAGGLGRQQFDRDTGRPAVRSRDRERDTGRINRPLPPPKQGTRIRFVDIPPDSAELLATSAARMKEAFAQIGDAAASTVDADSPHPLMHRTESFDYGIFIEGEIVLVLDDSEVTLAPGSVVVHRGTTHAWANRSGKPCRILFILVDGAYEPAIRNALDRRASSTK